MGRAADLLPDATTVDSAPDEDTPSDDEDPTTCGSKTQTPANHVWQSSLPPSYQNFYTSLPHFLTEF